jgi:hypothetical protein
MATRGSRQRFLAERVFGVKRMLAKMTPRRHLTIALNHRSDRAMSRRFQEFSPRGGCYPALAHPFRH